MFEVNDHEGYRIQACDSCNSEAKAKGLPEVTDDDVCSLPRARRALAKRLLVSPSGKPTRLTGRSLDRACADALSAYDLRVALSDVLAWAVTDVAVDRIARIADRARVGLGLEALHTW